MWRMLVVIVIACSSSKTEAPPAPPPLPDAVVRLQQTVDQLAKDSDAQGATIEPAVAASKEAHDRPALERARASVDKLVAETATLEQRAAAAVAEGSRLQRDATGGREAAYQRERAQSVESDLADRKKQLADATEAISANTSTLDRMEAKAKLEQLQHERDEALKAKPK